MSVWPLYSLLFYRNYLHQGHTNHQSSGHCTPDQTSPHLPAELDSVHYSLHLETIFQPLLTLVRACLSLLFITGFSDKNSINSLHFLCLPFCPSAVLVSLRANLWCRLFLRALVYIQNPTEHKKMEGLSLTDPVCVPHPSSYCLDNSWQPKCLFHFLSSQTPHAKSILMSCLYFPLIVSWFSLIPLCYSLLRLFPGFLS